MTKPKVSTCSNNRRQSAPATIARASPRVGRIRGGQIDKNGRGGQGGRGGQAAHEGRGGQGGGRGGQGGGRGGQGGGRGGQERGRGGQGGGRGGQEGTRNHRGQIARGGGRVARVARVATTQEKRSKRTQHSRVLAGTFAEIVEGGRLAPPIQLPNPVLVMPQGEPAHAPQVPDAQVQQAPVPDGPDVPANAVLPAGVVQVAQPVNGQVILAAANVIPPDEELQAPPVDDMPQARIPQVAAGQVPPNPANVIPPEVPQVPPVPPNGVAQAGIALVAQAAAGKLQQVPQNHMLPAYGAQMFLPAANEGPLQKKPKNKMGPFGFMKKTIQAKIDKAVNEKLALLSTNAATTGKAAAGQVAAGQAAAAQLPSYQPPPPPFAQPEMPYQMDYRQSSRFPYAMRARASRVRQRRPQNAYRFWNGRRPAYPNRWLGIGRGGNYTNRYGYGYDDWNVGWYDDGYGGDYYDFGSVYDEGYSGGYGGGYGCNYE